MANDDTPYFKAAEEPEPEQTVTIQSWPRVWLYYPREKQEGNVSYDTGDRIKVDKGGALHYSCPCGASWKRHPGFDNIRTRLWVQEHKPHLPPEEQQDGDHATK